MDIDDEDDVLESHRVICEMNLLRALRERKLFCFLKKNFIKFPHFYEETELGNDEFKRNFLIFIR